MTTEMDFQLLDILVAFVVADDPIVQLSGLCPKVSSLDPSLTLTADVPAYALARCRNGDKQLTSTDEVNFSIAGTFDQTFEGTRCQFYKKDGSNTYTVDVEVGWGERDSQVVQQRKIKTISCAYDAHGRAVSNTETISEWFLNPWESQHLLGGNASAVFELKVWDVLDQEITTDISIGRKIRLVAFDTSNRFPAFRALSCVARNAFGRYYVLRAGCGDGLVFQKITGFRTDGNCVYSPYFDAFKLNGGDDTVQFECVFTVCNDLCNGNSCPTETGFNSPKQKRAADLLQPYIVARSTPFRLN